MVTPRRDFQPLNTFIYCFASLILCCNVFRRVGEVHLNWRGQDQDDRMHPFPATKNTLPEESLILRSQRMLYNDSHHTVDGSLYNLRLAMVGDSLSRYQYVSLAHFAHNGQWVKDSDQPNILGTPRQWKSWEAFNAYTIAKIGGQQKENCNCYRPPGKINLNTSYNNRYFRDESRNIYLTYITKVGEPKAHGHWRPETVYFNHSDDAEVHSSQEYTWQYNWSEVITQHLAKLQPKPRYVVLNAGIWKQNDLSVPVFRSIRRALDEAGMLGIYKTTTRRSWENYTHSEPHDMDGCEILHACLNLSWTGTLKYRPNYWDPVHFMANVNTHFNQQLLHIIEKLEN